MAKYDQGGGCGCGLYKECNCEVNSEPWFHGNPVNRKPYVGSMKRPWGEWHVLDVDQGYKVKRLEILPDAAISLQYHIHRTETWTIVQGEGKVIVDGNVFSVKKGDTFFVPRQSIHKITNTHLKDILIAVEVQIGEICNEDDIVRC